LLRDCDVVITSWTDARIPWPRCRALDGTGGGSGLLLDEELARAVRHESAAAVMYWWGASSEAVKRWRRALGVGRTDNEGSRRLIRAAAAGGDAVRLRFVFRWRSRRSSRIRMGCAQGKGDDLMSEGLLTGKGSRPPSRVLPASRRDNLERNG
jgi:hypothetical protein